MAVSTPRPERTFSATTSPTLDTFWRCFPRRVLSARQSTRQPAPDSRLYELADANRRPSKRLSCCSSRTMLPSPRPSRFVSLKPRHPYIASTILHHADWLPGVMTRSQILQILRKGKTALWCGAGISVPSGLPAARDLLRFLARNLQRLESSDAELLATTNLPFELTIQLLRPALRILRFAELFTTGSPTSTHRLIAHLVREGLVKTICTTNFDLLLERALDEVGMRSGRDYDLHSTAADFERTDWRTSRPRILKLHGTADRPRTIVTTLRAVLTRELDDRQSAVIDTIFSRGEHANVLTLGYSFSDVFDLIPQIRSVAGRKKRVVVVQHSANRRIVRDPNLAARLSDALRYPPSSIFAVKLNTQLLISTLSKGLGAHPLEADGRPSDWKKLASRMMRPVSRAQQLRIVGRIFEMAGDLARAARYYHEALKRPRSRQRFRGQVMLDIGRVSSASGNYPKALDFALRSNAIASDIGDRSGEAASLGILAVANHNLGEFQEAIKYGREAIQKARAADEDRIEEHAHGNLGLTHRSLGRYESAAQSHSRALEIARLIRDKHGEANQLTSI